MRRRRIVTRGGSGASECAHQQRRPLLGRGGCGGGVGHLLANEHRPRERPGGDGDRQARGRQDDAVGAGGGGDVRAIPQEQGRAPAEQIAHGARRVIEFPGAAWNAGNRRHANLAQAVRAASMGDLVR